MASIAEGGICWAGAIIYLSTVFLLDWVAHRSRADPGIAEPDKQVAPSVAGPWELVP